MAVKMHTVDGIVHYTGLSSDPKLLSGIRNGSTHHVVDTGEVYVAHDGMWELDLRDREKVMAVELNVL